MFKDKLICDVAEVSKLGQLKELEDASDNELVDITNTTVEVLEHCESREGDTDLRLIKVSLKWRLRTIYPKLLGGICTTLRQDIFKEKIMQEKSQYWSYNTRVVVEAWQA